MRRLPARINRRHFLAVAGGAAIGLFVWQVRGVMLITCIVVVIFLCIAGVVVVKIIRFCDKHLGRGTNLPSLYTNRPNITGRPELPPMCHEANTNATVSFQATTDLKNWTELLTYDYQDNCNGTLTVRVRQRGVVRLEKVVPIQCNSDGPYAVANFIEESCGMFPESQGQMFRLMSAQ